MGKVYSTDASAPPPSEIDISYVKLLQPYAQPNDHFISEDYKDTYGFKDCAEHIEKLTPYWLAAKNCNAHIVLKKMFLRNDRKSDIRLQGIRGEKGGVEVFDFSDINVRGLFRGRQFILGNGHPSAEAHRFYSDLLYYEIKIRDLDSYLR